MDKTATEHASNGGGHPAVHPKFSKTGSAPAAPPTERVADPKETAQEALHQVMPDDAVTGPKKPVPAKVAPPTAAKGDDDLMSQEKKSS